MKVGLALGSGSARGFSHIGIIDCLLDQGIVPDVVAGTSIGAEKLRHIFSHCFF